MKYLFHHGKLLMLTLLAVGSITGSLASRAPRMMNRTPAHIANQNAAPKAGFLVTDAQMMPQNLGLTKEKNAQEQDFFKWSRTFMEVMQIVMEKHWRDTKVDIATVIQDALKATVPNIDAHSSFFGVESYKAAVESTSGEFSGIGIGIMNKAPEDDSLIIIDVFEGGPGGKAGIKVGDKIVDVEGNAVRGQTTDEILYKLRGKTGSAVTLKIIRDKKPLEFKIKREVIKDQSVASYYFKNYNTFYISLKIFSDIAASQMAKVLEQAAKKDCKGIIIDLRRNPGGVLDVAVDIAELFIDKGSLVVSTKDKSRTTTRSYFTKKDPLFKANVPIFILIDNFSASASEILSGCLKHYSDQANNEMKKNLRVFFVGTETFGKGSVQEVIPISNGCALKMTTMLYFLPNDNSIQAKGIAPDFLVKPKTIPEQEIKWVNELYGKETSLKHHITENEVLGKPDDPKAKKKEQQVKDEELDDDDDSPAAREKLAKNWEERHQKAIKRDVQIQAAVNLINLLNIADHDTPQLVNTRKKALNFLNQNFAGDDNLELEQIK